MLRRCMELISLVSMDRQLLQELKLLKLTKYKLSTSAAQNILKLFSTLPLKNKWHPGTIKKKTKNTYSYYINFFGGQIFRYLV